MVGSTANTLTLRLTCPSTAPSSKVFALNTTNTGSSFNNCPSFSRSEPSAARLSRLRLSGRLLISTYERTIFSYFEMTSGGSATAVPFFSRHLPSFPFFALKKNLSYFLSLYRSSAHLWRGAVRHGNPWAANSSPSIGALKNRSKSPSSPMSSFQTWVTIICFPDFPYHFVNFTYTHLPCSVLSLNSDMTSASVGSPPDSPDLRLG